MFKKTLSFRPEHSIIRLLPIKIGQKLKKPNKLIPWCKSSINTCCHWNKPRPHKCSIPNPIYSPLSLLDMVRSSVTYLSQSPYLSALDFWQSLVWNSEFDELNSFPNLNWIFTACVVCKNPVQTKRKIQFIKLEISNWRMSKINCR